MSLAYNLVSKLTRGFFFGALQEEIGNLVNLKTLDASRNMISHHTLPGHALGNLKALSKLYLGCVQGMCCWRRAQGLGQSLSFLRTSQLT